MVVEVREVRPAEFADAGAVTMSAYLEYVPGRDDPRPGFAHDDWTEYLSMLADVGNRADHAIVLVAIEDSTVIGCATLELHDRINPDGEPLRPGEAHLRMLAVDPAHRGHGVGEQLVAACFAAAAKAGKTEMTLNSSDEMRAAHRLYERMGFRRGADRHFENGAMWRTYHRDVSPVEPS